MTAAPQDAISGNINIIELDGMGFGLFVGKRT